MDSSSSPSSSSMSVSNNREVSLSTAPPAEDDGAFSVNSGLAKEAEQLFQSGKYTECLRVLNQLAQKKEDDPKVLHNIAIAEIQDGPSDPKRLLEALNNAKKQCEELARASGGNIEAVSDIGDKGLPGVRGNDSVANQLLTPDSSPLLYTGEFDTSVMLYNMAVAWFHLHDYLKSFSLLDALFQNIEPIDEGTAIHICLLLLDVALLSHRTSRSVEVIGYLEKSVCADSLISQNDNGSSLQQQPSTLVTKSNSLPSNSSIHDTSHSDLAGTANSLEGSLSRTLSEEAIEEESLILSSLDISGQNLPRPTSFQSSNDLPRTQANESISSIDLRLRLHLCKIQLFLLTRNLKAAKREVKMAINTARGKDYSMALYLKSQLEYARGNYRKAIKVLMASSNRTETGISSICYNNLGCIFYRLGKYHTSSIFFSKALSNSSSIRKEKPLKFASLSQDKSFLIIYNSGMQQLACGKPLLAARCFYKASVIFYNKPLLWLRIAECCLMGLEKGLPKFRVSPSDRSEIKVHVVGKGKWRHLVVDEGFSRNRKLGFIGREDLLGDDRQPNLSLPLARQCLINALHLLYSSGSKLMKSGSQPDVSLEENESRETVPSKSTSYKNASVGDSKLANTVAGSGQVNVNGEVKEQKGGSSQNTSLLLSSISDYEEICRKEKQMIEQVILADLAYVELELGNPLKALSTARSLLELPGCSRLYIFLGNVYAAEALCLLNRPKEAVEHLSGYISGGNSVQLPYTQEDCDSWQVNKISDCEESNGGPADMNSSSVDNSRGFSFLKPEEARGILYANLATVSALQGDLEQAHRFVIQALSIIPNSPEAVLTAVYVDLARGKTQDALIKLKQCSHVTFLPGSLTLNGS